MLVTYVNKTRVAPINLFATHLGLPHPPPVVPLVPMEHMVCYIMPWLRMEGGGGGFGGLITIVQESAASLFVKRVITFYMQRVAFLFVKQLLFTCSVLPSLE